jgi:hypothetical protein
VENIEFETRQMELTSLASNPTCGAVSATVNPRNNLPKTTSYRYDYVQDFPQALFAAINLIHDANTNLLHPSSMSKESESNENLSTPEKELLHWHARLCHLAFSQDPLLDAKRRP